MQIRTALFVIVLAAVVLLAALNLDAFMAPAALSLGIATVHAPLGLVMLGFVAVLTTMFLAFVVYLQGTVLLETRRQARELQVQRDLADKAELSRTEAGFARIEARIDKLDADFGTALDHVEASMAAYVGELDDRLKRAS